MKREKRGMKREKREERDEEREERDEESVKEICYIIIIMMCL